jgi:hypothetical protein
VDTNTTIPFFESIISPPTWLVSTPEKLRIPVFT